MGIHTDRPWVPILMSCTWPAHRRPPRFTPVRTSTWINDPRTDRQAPPHSRSLAHKSLSARLRHQRRCPALRATGKNLSDRLHVGSSRYCLQAEVQPSTPGKTNQGCSELMRTDFLGIRAEAPAMPAGQACPRHSPPTRVLCTSRGQAQPSGSLRRERGGSEPLLRGPATPTVLRIELCVSPVLAPSRVVVESRNEIPSGRSAGTGKR